MAYNSELFKQDLDKIVDKFDSEIQRISITDLKAYLDREYSQAVLNSVNREIANPNTEATLADRLSHYLSELWSQIQHHSLAYTASPHSVLTNLIVEIAKLLHRNDPSKAVYQYMMPSVVCVEDSIGICDLATEEEGDIESIDDWQLSRVILSEDKSALIPVCIMNYISSDTPLSELCLPYRKKGDTENTRQLSLDEQQRLQKHSLESKVYFSLLHNISDSAIDQSTAGGNIEALIANLQQAGARNQGTEGSAGQAAYLGVQQFYVFLNTLQEPQRKLLLAMRQDKNALRSASNYSLGDVLEILSQHRIARMDDEGNNIMQDGKVLYDTNPMTCVEVNADILKQILEQNRASLFDQHTANMRDMLDLAKCALKKMNLGADHKPYSWLHCLDLIHRAIDNLGYSTTINLIGYLEQLENLFKSYGLFDGADRDAVMIETFKQLLAREDILTVNHLYYVEGITEDWGDLGIKSIIGPLLDGRYQRWSSQLCFQMVCSLICSSKCSVDYLRDKSVDLKTILMRSLQYHGDQSPVFYEKLLRACEGSSTVYRCSSALPQRNLLIAAITAQKPLLAIKLLQSIHIYGSAMMSTESTVQGKTALMHAAELGDRSLVKTMVGHPLCGLAMLQCRDEDGRTAADHSQDEGIKTLLAEALQRTLTNRSIHASRRSALPELSFLVQRQSRPDSNKESEEPTNKFPRLE